MGKAIQVRLDPVRRRQQQLRALTCAAIGLFASSFGLLVCIALRWLGGWQISAALVAILAVAAPTFGYIVGMLWRRDWREAAAAVDAHYGFKDRIITALDFLHKSQTTKVHRLAVSDAMDHLDRVDARQVIPSDTPQMLPVAIMSLAVAALLFVFTSLPARLNASPAEAIPVIVEAADYASEELKSLEEFAREEQDAEVEKLVTEMKQALEEMKQPGVDLREALAKLSQMQAALEQQQSKFNIGQVDAELQAVGDALALAESMAEAGKALAAGQLERAAEELEKLDTPKLDRKTEKAIKEKLDALARQMQDSGSSSLSAAVGEASQGLGGDGSRFKQGMKRLAGEARKQGKRKRLNDLLRKQCGCLGECKGECECNGGFGKGKGGSNWGRGASGNELGEKTPEIGGKYESRITGRQSEEGEVEVETTHSPEGKQEAQRDYRATYDKYRKISEAVLDSEPIPLGHRQTIRRYFEAIRPSEAEADAVQAATKSP
jgi:hypothetical protein